jgi:hypothetical protein
MRTLPQTPTKAQRWIWRRRLAALDREAAAEIRRLQATGRNYDQALSAMLASAAGAKALAEYSAICDALAAEASTARGLARLWNSLSGSIFFAIRSTRKTVKPS